MLHIGKGKITPQLSFPDTVCDPQGILHRHLDHVRQLGLPTKATGFHIRDQYETVDLAKGGDARVDISLDEDGSGSLVLVHQVKDEGWNRIIRISRIRLQLEKTDAAVTVGDLGDVLVGVQANAAEKAKS